MVQSKLTKGCSAQADAAHGRSQDNRTEGSITGCGLCGFADLTSTPLGAPENPRPVTGGVAQGEAGWFIHSEPA